MRELRAEDASSGLVWFNDSRKDHWTSVPAVLQADLCCASLVSDCGNFIRPLRDIRPRKEHIAEDGVSSPVEMGAAEVDQCVLLEGEIQGNATRPKAASGEPSDGRSGPRARFNRCHCVSSKSST